MRLLTGLRLYLFFAAIVVIGVAVYISSPERLEQVLAWWPASVTMIVGSFIAGASAEGGGAIAFPVFTLILQVSPEDARNFSFAIQSIGMVSASLLIIGKGIPIEWRGIAFPALGGVIGIIIGTYAIIPLLEPVTTKLFFVSLWMAFGIGLWRANRNASRIVRAGLGASLVGGDVLRLVLTGLVGGVVTAIFGNGVDLVTFCMLTLWYGVDEKVATPTSVVLMSIITVAGFLFHGAVLGDVQQSTIHAWIAAAPVVLVFAPLGAWVISRWNRLSIARLLYTIIVVQLLGAIVVLGATLPNIALCFVVITLGTAAMKLIDRTSKPIA
ncbi:MAG: TSUP family transporter [Ignavibacteria bacterium]|jgi:uncharacterized membrane protein YfcA